MLIISAFFILMDYTSLPYIQCILKNLLSPRTFKPSPITLVSSTNKTDCHDITEILLKHPKTNHKCETYNVQLTDNRQSDTKRWQKLTWPFVMRAKKISNRHLILSRLG